MLIYFLISSLYFFIAWFKQKWALLLIILFLPVYQLRFQIFNLPTTLLEVMILTLFIILLIKRRINWHYLITKKIWFYLILVWLIIGLMTVLISPDQWSGLGHWRAYFFEPILFLIIFLSLIKDEKDLRAVFVILSILALFISGWVIYQKITGQGMASLEVWQYPLVSTTRPVGPFPHSNFLGLFLGPMIVIFFGKFLENLGNKKLLISSYWLLVTVVGGLAIIFAKSEGAILAGLVGLIFFLLFYFKKRRRTMFIVILLLIISYLLLFSPWKGTIYQKITFQDLSLKLRLNIWQGAWQMIKSSPFLGVGLRGYQQLVDQYQQPFSLPGVKGIISNEFHPYPHNLFLTLWLELGILGLIVFFLILIKFFVDGFKNKKLKPIVISAMMVIVIHGLIDTPYFKNDLAILFWLIVGLILIENNSKILENK